MNMKSNHAQNTQHICERKKHLKVLRDQNFIRVLSLLSGFILVGDRSLTFLVCHVLVF